MDIRPPSTRSVINEKKRERKRKQGAVMFIIATGISLAILVPSYGLVINYIEVPNSPHGVKPDAVTAFKKILLSLPSYYLDKIRDNRHKKTLWLDIKHKHLEKIALKRKEAFRRGILVKSDDDYVPATVRYGDESVLVKVRLKGDLLDHLEGRRWSFRVKTRNDETVLGMRKFSVQAPYTRGYQGEPLFLGAARAKGILAPRSFFVTFYINGERIGVMNVEESFSKEMLESQQRRDSPILKYDETYFWQAMELFFNTGLPAWKPYINWRSTPMLSFQQERVNKNEMLRASDRYSKTQMQQLADATIAPIDVFDVEAFGKYLAICELFGGGHMTHWNNMRFYANPYTAKLEPIVFDANVLPVMPVNKKLSCVGGIKALTTSLLSDKYFAKTFVNYLNEYSRWVMNSEFDHYIKEKDELYRDTLKHDYPWLPVFDIDVVKARASSYRQLTVDNMNDFISPLITGMDELDINDSVQMPSLVNAQTYKENGAWWLRINNFLPVDVIVEGIGIKKKGSKTSQFGGLSSSQQDSQQDSQQEFPLTIAASSWPNPASRIIIAMPETSYEGKEDVEGIVKVKGAERKYRFISRGQVSSFANHAHDKNIALSRIIERYPFFVFDSTSNTLSVERGDWLIEDWLVLQDGVKLNVSAGTTLRFVEGVGLIVKGAISLLGSKQSPIYFQPVGKSWSGLGVVAHHAVHQVEHVVFKRTEGVSNRGHQFSGGVNFYQGKVIMRDVTLQGSSAEDAMNIVGSEIDINGLTISDASSDALDIDFGTGQLDNLNVYHAGGDGLDISGSIIKLSRSSFHDIHDKGVSVGENSRLTASRIVVDGSGTGIASKDGSTTKITNAIIRNIEKVALMAYQKKKEYGSAIMTAQGISIVGANEKAVSQFGSNIQLNGTDIMTQNVDVVELYDVGYMQK